MASINMQQLAKKAGFSRVIGTSNSQFVLLSREADGSSGRKIFIDWGLAPTFAALVAREDHHKIFHQLLQLKSTAGGNTSYSDINNAFEHMHIVESLKVSYTIMQASSEGKPAGVYITSIDFSELGKQDRAGLYKVKCDQSRVWSLQDTEKALPKPNTKNIALNGLCDNKLHAAESIMPSLVIDAYKDRDGADHIKTQGYTLFYNPQGRRVGGKSMISPEQKQTNHEHVVGLLGNTLLKAQNDSRKYQWTVHGSGAKIFSDAMKRLDGQTLDCHEVMFMAPTMSADMKNTIRAMKNSNMTLHPDVMKFNADDWSGLNHRTYGSKGISAAVKDYGDEYATVSEVLKARGVGSSVAVVCWAQFVANIGIASVFKHKSLRNISAQMLRVTNENVNPHFHPEKDHEQFNAHAKLSSEGGAYQALFTELVKKLKR